MADVTDTPQIQLLPGENLDLPPALINEAKAALRRDGLVDRDEQIRFEAAVDYNHALNRSKLAILRIAARHVDPNFAEAATAQLTRLLQEDLFQIAPSKSKSCAQEMFGFVNAKDVTSDMLMENFTETSPTCLPKNMKRGAAIKAP